jgi:diguanylate cyclase
MTLNSLAASLKGLMETLKFKIVAIAVLTGLAASAGTTKLVLSSTQSHFNELLFRQERADLEGNAAHLADKVDTLRSMLAATARQLSPEQLRDPAGLTVSLRENVALHSLFSSVYVVVPSGEILVRMMGGVPSADRPNVADRDYIRQVMRTDQPVISQPLVGLVSKVPLLAIALPVLDPLGQTVGAVVGTLALRSSPLFSNLGGVHAQQHARTLVMDRQGVLLGHPEASRVLGQAADEPGMAAAYQRWADSGSPIDTLGVAQLSGGHMVTMAGIPGTDWMLVRLIPQEDVWQPVAKAQQTAWLATAGVGLLSALLAGVLAWWMTRPISRLRARAEMMLQENVPMPNRARQCRGEVGELARAFDQVVAQRQKRQGETQALLQQLEAVLDHAEVGIALTRNGHFELVSRQFCRIFRCTKSDAIGQATRMIHASDEAYQAFSERAHPVFMEHGAFDGEVQLVRRNGAAFWAQMRGRAVVPGDRSQGTIWTFEDVTEVREQRERMSWTSTHDALTGLCNRPAFEDRLEVAAAKATAEPFCALFIDLDRFKLVNDTGGHAAGDALLRDVAHALAAEVRSADTVARLGGDEFAVLLDGCPLPQAKRVAEKLRTAVLKYSLLWEGQRFSVGASIGVVPVDGRYQTAAEVLRAADAACYDAKRRGRNCVSVHGETQAAIIEDASAAALSI